MVADYRPFAGGRLDFEGAPIALGEAWPSVEGVRVSPRPRKFPQDWPLAKRG